VKREGRTVDKILSILEFWLRNGNEYLMTETHPSLADMSCYNEVVQLEVMGLLTHANEKFPRVAAWLKRMTVLAVWL
jgi:glutathione S-transferase